MKKIKKYKTMIFAVVCIISIIFAACSTDNANDGNNADDVSKNADDSPVVEETTKNEYSEFPDVKMDGRVFTIMNPQYSIERHFYTAEEETGDSLNDAAYRRNVELEERFDISIEVYGASNQDCYAALNKIVASGDDFIDLVVPHPNIGITSLITEGLLLNWLNMKYIDFSKPCWNVDMQNTFKINDKLFYACGDIPVTSVGIGAVLFNKAMVQELGLENPYNYVFSGTWTIDKFIEFTKGASKDVNGDGAMDKNDIFGYINNVMDYGYIWSSGLKIARNDEAGKPTLSLLGERLGLVIEKMNVLINGADSYTVNDFMQSFDHFEDGRALTINWDIGTYWMNLRPIEFDFGILPLPKLDESQENYYNFVGAGLMGIPCNVKDPENVSIIIQAYAEGSYKYLRPAFFGNVLYNKCLKDEESQNIMEMIHSSKVYDVGFSFDSKKIMPYIITEVVTKAKGTDYVSFYEKHADNVQADFDLIYEYVINNAQ
ncbi:MAG: hypothetical protein FWH48_06245 [Oscillospiraceae bacterium]|nr:hypothetical protein [Oscillospiraceae bacterium]